MAEPSSETVLPSVVDFYAARDVFITGATGFMGKCLLEKLLRSVPDLGKVFVLTRPKKGKSPEQRTKELLAGPLFERLRKESPSATDKVVPVVGDIQEPGLGLGERDRAMLQETVSIVFHLAATVRFESPLREALTKNVASVSALVALCRGMKNLKSLVHVSSAYAQCNRQGVIDEISYPTAIPPSKLLGLLDWMTDDQLNTLAPTLTSGYPNTYTYTKGLAEQVLLDEAKGLPVAIYRPSIIGASLNEPVEGWVDVLHGPTGVFIAVGKGFLRVFRCDEYRKADFVPVDLVNNLLISIGWITGLNPDPSSPVFYNYSSSTLNPMNWLQLSNYFMSAQSKYPLEDIYRRPWVCKARPAQLYPLFNFFLHLIPGFIGDIILRVMKRKPFFVRTYSKLNFALQQLDYFMQMDWRWTNRNSDKLYSLMSVQDRQTFNFDIRSMNWKVYINRYILGVKRYLLHEDLADLPKARQNIKRLRNMRYTFNFIVFLLATRVLYRRSEVARQLWNGVLEFCVRWIAKLGIPTWHSF